MPQPFVPEDLAHFQDLSQLVASGPAGMAACVVRNVDLEADTYSSAIWTFSLDGATARRFTQGTSGDTSPAWSPDGSQLAFVSTRGGLPQIHVMHTDGGEAVPLSHLAQGAGSFQWSPDGKALLALCALALDPDSREEARVVSSRDPDAPQLAWRLPYKSDGVGYLLGRAFHMFRIDASTGDDRQLTSGAFDVLAATWSPDSRRVAFTRTREGREAHRTDLWMLDVASGDARQLTREFASVMTPRWSPDGRWIAFGAARDEGDAQTRLNLLDVESGSARQIGDDDMELASPATLHWAGDSKALYLVIAWHACQHVVKVDLDGSKTVLVAGERHVSELAITDQHLVYLSESADSPRELCVAQLDGTGERRLSFLNTWWDDRTPLDAEIRRFTVPDGQGGEETIEGWLVRARGAKGPQPLMVEAHGGPNSFALLGYPWNTYWNVLCSRGWAVVVPHCVGSTSFGRKFAERLNGHWGELDFPQFMAVVDALQAEGIADERVVIAGKSYGGYMAAWAIGHTSRFKAAIVAAPVANLESHFGTSDGGFYSQPYALGGERYIAAERYRALSPVNYAQNCVTPTLILQGKEDERCPRGQSEELYAVLVRTDRAPAQMVMYPGGDHHLYEKGKPSHRLDVVRRMVEWLERHV